MKSESTEKQFSPAGDVEKELSIGRTTAYKIIRTLNAELKRKGFMTQAGRVPRRFFMERFGLE